MNKKDLFLSLLEGLAYHIDLFKLGFNFNFSKGRKKISTVLGTLFSLIILMILLISLLNSNMIQKINPAVISQTIPIVDGVNIDINNKNFNIFFGIVDNNYKNFSIDPSYVKIKVLGAEIIKNSNSNQANLLSREFSFHKCSELEINVNKNFANLGYSTAYCLDPFEWSLHGNFFDRYFSYLSIQMSVCNNITMNNTCKSEKEIEEFVQNKVLAIFYMDSYIDFSNYEEPIKEFSRIDQIYLAANSYTAIKIQFKKGEMLDDDAFLLNSNKTYDYFQKEERFSQTLSKNFYNENVPIAEFFFAGGNYLDKSSRIYEKLPDVLAKLSGIANFLIFLGFIIMNYVNGIFLNLYFLKKLFNSHFIDLDEDLKDENKLSETKVKAASLEIIIPFTKYKEINLKSEEKNKEKTLEIIEKYTKIPPKIIEDERENINMEEKSTNFKIPANKDENYYKRIFLKHYSLGIIDYIILKIKCLFSGELNKKEKFFFKSEKELKKMLDIKLQLRKIMNGENLKNVILTPKQLTILNSMHKTFSIKDQKHFFEFKSIKEILENSKYSMSEIDEKIVKLFKKSKEF